MATFARERLGMRDSDVFPAGQGRVMPWMVLYLFIAEAGGRLKTSTIQNYRAAIRAWHADKGVKQEDCPTNHYRRDGVNKIMKAVRREYAVEGEPKRKQALSAQLLQLLARLERKEVRSGGQAAARAGRDRAWMLLGFGAFLRKSELAALKRSDIAVGADGVVSVRMRQSKTDQLKRGVTVLVNGKIAEVSVVAAVEDLLGHHDRAGLGSEDAIFRSTEGPTAGRAAAKDALVRAFKRRVMAASKRFSLGLKAEDYAGHSLRRGGVQLAHSLGVPREMLKRHGRWRSDAIDAYLDKTTYEDKVRVTSCMADVK